MQIKATISTAGVADLQEEIVHSSSVKLSRGDRVALKPTKPSTASVYGEAIVRDAKTDGGRVLYTSVRVN